MKTIFTIASLVILFVACCLLPLFVHSQDGSLDLSFGTGGIIITPLGNPYSTAYSVAIQSDDKIVAAGYSGDFSNTYFALVRYNYDGSKDTTFGTGGIVTTPPGSGVSVAIQIDDKIVVAGSSITSANDFALVRYTSNGELDTTFGSAGIVTTDFGSQNDYVHSVAIQTNGKIVVAGTSYNVNNNFALARYNSNGSLDSTFGSGGKVTTDFLNNTDGGSSVVIQTNGRIILAGSSDFDFALARYYTDGSLDNTFGLGGKVTTTIGSNSYIYSVALQNDGKIVAAGVTLFGQYYKFALARYNTNGSLDNTFGTGGKVTTDIRNSDDVCNSVRLQTDGKIVLAGWSSNDTTNDFVLVRYNSNGTLDSTFGTGGIVFTSIGNDCGSYSIAMQSNEKIVAVGYTNNSDFAIARYNNLTLGIESNSNTQSTITISPNPATNHLTITMGNSNRKVEVIITDIAGKIVYKFPPTDEHSIEVDIKDFEAGIYLVKIQSGEFRETKKFVVE